MEKDKTEAQSQDAPENIEELKKELAEARAKADANLAGWQRAQADLINYRKRCEQEKEETVKYANSNLILKLIPVLDNFDRAISSIPKEIADQPWVKGVSLIKENMFRILEAQGLKPIECEGVEFDPSQHEALMQCKGKENIVIKEIEKGYLYNNRLLRPARVMVGCGDNEETGSNKEE